MECLGIHKSFISNNSEKEKVKHYLENKEMI